MRYSPSLNCLINSTNNLNKNKKCNNHKEQLSKLNQFIKITSLLITIALIITVLVFSIETEVSSTNEIRNLESYVQVIVKKGDTLWSIAREYGDATQDIRKVCESIRVANDVENNILMPGQLLLIPKSV